MAIKASLDSCISCHYNDMSQYNKKCSWKYVLKIIKSIFFPQCSITACIQNGNSIIFCILCSGYDINIIPDRYLFKTSNNADFMSLSSNLFWSFTIHNLGHFNLCFAWLLLVSFFMQSGIHFLSLCSYHLRI